MKTLNTTRLHWEDLPKRVRKAVPYRLEHGRMWLSAKADGFASSNNLRLKAGIVALKKFYKDKRPRHIKITIHVTLTKVFIGFLLGLALWPHTGRIVAETPNKPVAVKVPSKVAVIPQTALAPQEPVQPAPAPQPAYTPPPGIGCGTYFSGDADLDWIISRESGGNSCAVNASSGACGVAQELPCGKSGCALGDGNCQIAWMRNYCVARYGSVAGAKAYWLVHSNY